jgi:fibronectin-binding autotransporter adhesin
MPTPVFVCGAECGIAVVGTTSAGVEHWSSILGTPSVVTSGPASMRSTRAFRFNPSAATSALVHTLTTATGSPGTVVGRFYVYFATLPSASIALFFDNVNQGGVYYDQASSQIRAGIGAGATAAGVAVTTGQWYRVDFKIVQATTFTADVQVDGVAGTQFTVGSSNAAISQIVLGDNSNTSTADYYIDDFVLSATSGDYPIGEGTVAGLYPRADGTHGGGWSSGDFGKGTGGSTAAATSNTDMWQSLDNPLVSTAAGAWVAAKVRTLLSFYVEFLTDALPAAASSVNGAMLVATTHSASATTSQFNLQVADATNAVSLIAADLSESTITLPIAVRNTDASGVAWTPTTINALKMRFGSTDTNPDVYLDGYVWEVDYVESAGDSVAIDGKGTNANVGVGSMQRQAVVAGRGDNATTGAAAMQRGAVVAGRGDNASAGSAAAQAAMALAGRGTAATTGAADLTVTSGSTISLDGRGDNASAGTAGLQRLAVITGRGDAASSGTGNALLAAYLTGQGTNASTGRGANSSAGTASALRAAALSGTGTASSTGTASVLRSAVLAGRGDNASAGTANALTALALTGQGTNASTGTASVARAVALSGSGPACSAGTADLTVGVTNAVTLTGTGAASSTGRAAVQRAAALDGHGDACSAGNADLTVTAQNVVTLAGSGTATSGATAVLRLAASLAGNGTNSSSGTATVRVVCALAGFGAASSAGNATLRVLLALTGHGDAATAGSGSINATAFLPDPEAITLQLRDRTHTETIEDRGHMVTARER